MSYTLRPTGRVEAERIDESWGSLRWLAGQQTGNAQGVTLGRVIIKKGQANPRHIHPNCEEVLYLLRGRLEHLIGGERVLQEAGDKVVVAAGTPHVAKSIGDEDAEMLVAYSSGVRGYEPAP